MQKLVEALFSLSLTTPRSGIAEGVRATIAQASEASWSDSLDLLALHKLFPLLSFRLAEAQLLEALPSAQQQRLLEMHAEVRARNALLLLTLARLLRLAEARRESLLVLKGILFADSYYPDYSTRPMSDIDLVAVRGHDESLFALLEQAGFRPSLHHTVQEHSVTFMNREGVFCDAHRTLPMFVTEPWHRITSEVELSKVHGVRALALEPNAMVAHLAAHMFGHSREMGFVLLWIVDLAFVLDRFAEQLDAARIRKLIAHDAAWALLLRLSQLIARASGRQVPVLARHARLLPPLTLAAVLRQRRIKPWGIPAPLGWARLCAHQLGLHRSERPLPRPTDLVLWPVDLLSACVTPPLARVALR